MDTFLMSSYQHLPVAFTRGSGAVLIDENGTEYLDALAGIAVCGLGHAHPGIRDVIADQAGKVIHTSNLYRIPLQEQLAEKLTGLSGMQKVFFSNSGAEANEAAIKIARLQARKKGISEPVIIVFRKSFHGRTMATLSATGNTRVQNGFDPLLQGFVHLPYNDVDSLSELVEQNNNVVAVMLEPILGEGGVVVPEPGYLRSVRSLCDRHDILMILDEIQTGMCRTGKWFACQHEDILPDVMTLAKALGNGVPIGACMARGSAADLIQPGSHGSTFGGNPLAARVGLEVVRILSDQQLDREAANTGAKMLDGFRQQLDNTAGVVDIRGKGLMIGIELDRKCTDLVTMGLEKRVLLNVTSENVVRLLPPLIISPEQADSIVECISAIIRKFLETG